MQTSVLKMNEIGLAAEKCIILYLKKFNCFFLILQHHSSKSATSLLNSI